MIPAIGLAMGALSSVSSLVDQAASSVSNAVNTASSATPSPEAFTPAATSATVKAKAKLALAKFNPGVPIPKFDKRTHAALLSAQEKLRA